MRFTNSALQLLMLYRFASASPCKPSSILTSSIAESTLSTLVSMSTSVQEAETSTTVLSQPTTSESETTSDSLTTSSSETSTIAASTTTTVASGPTNILLNPGFEDGTIDPWQRLASDGSVSLSDDSFEGEHSGHFSLPTSPGGPAHVGFRQNISPSLIKANTDYQFSVHFKTMSSSGCVNPQLISCSGGGAYFHSQSFSAPLGQWGSVTTTCSWTEDFLNRGPSIEVRSACETYDLYIDEAVLVELSTITP
ncbi:uncharacterized protein QYS62_001678 [Fusarium acuminatum]|uniref:CBM-cenC domain-containing protein n=1 Tax=Fusarium acuminatum TaxID=5515 RepID=A0ABZ2WKD7_9HYPO